MKHYREVIHGIVKFIDDDLLPKMHGLNRWLFGTGAGIMANKSDKLFEEFKHNTLIKTLGIMNDEGMVDVVCIYKELLRQAEHEPVDIEVPMLGTITLDKSDVEKMYRYIMED